jgi:hypothetical protein
VVLLEVGVIPAGPRRTGFKFVGEGRAGLHRWLRDPRHPVHRVRHIDPVPVDGRRLGEGVFQQDPHPLALLQPQLRARDLAVIRHGLDDLARGQLPGDLARLQMDLPEAVAGVRCGAGVTVRQGSAPSHQG